MAAAWLFAGDAAAPFRKFDAKVDPCVVSV